MAQPTTTPFTGLVRAPEPIGDMPPRHILRPTSLRALHCVPSGVVVCAWLPEPCPAATGGSGFTIETGSESAIGIGQGGNFKKLVLFPRISLDVFGIIGENVGMETPILPSERRGRIGRSPHEEEAAVMRIPRC